MYKYLIIKKILFVILLLIVLTGCSRTESNKLTLKEKISKSYEYYSNIKCSNIDNVIDLNFGGFVTKNKAYELDVEQLYSNGENCKEVSINNLDDEIIMGSGQSIAYTKKFAYGIGKNYQKVIYSNKEYPLFSTLGNMILYHSSNYTNGYYIVSIDNKIKMIKTIGNEEEITIKNIIDVDTDFSSDEQVLSISEYFIKTNKAYYKIIKYKENKEECEKYADIRCKYNYKISKDKVLTSNYNDILFAGFYIVDKDHNIYKYK